MGSKVGDVINKQAGDVMPDDSIYLGCYRGRDWYVAAEDAKDGKGNPLSMTFNKASKYVRSLKAHGHDDWQIPNEDVLKAMYQSRNEGAFVETYNEGRVISQDCYWSSTLGSEFVKTFWHQDSAERSKIYQTRLFSSEETVMGVGATLASAVRPVRSEKCMLRRTIT